MARWFDVTIKERGRVSLLEGDHEVQIDVCWIKPFSRRRAEQVEALDAVAPADLPCLLDLSSTRESITSH